MTREKKKTIDQNSNMCSEWQDLKMMQTLYHKKINKYVDINEATEQCFF